MSFIDKLKYYIMNQETNRNNRITKGQRDSRDHLNNRWGFTSGNLML